MLSSKITCLAIRHRIEAREHQCARTRRPRHCMRTFVINYNSSCSKGDRHTCYVVQNIIYFRDMISKQFFQIVLFWTHCRTGKSIGIINVFDQMTGRLSVGAVGYRAAVFLPPGPEMAGSIPGLANTLFNGASWRPRYFDLRRVLILQPISCTQTHLI
jgi:hypothetical protein